MKVQKQKRHRHDERNKLFIPSDASLLAQNRWIDQYGLQRYSDAAELRKAVEDHALTPVGPTGALLVDSRLPQDRRYLRPWVLPFLAELSEEYYNSFHSPLVLTSAVRTVRVQRSLLHRNRAAAPWKGPLESSHVAGSTFDLSRLTLTREQTKWLEDYFTLHYLYWGDVQVEEERHCFHVMVRPGG